MNEGLHPAVPEPARDDVDVVVVPDEFGAVVMGDSDAVAAFEAEWNVAHGVGREVAPGQQRKLFETAGKRFLRRPLQSVRYLPGPSLWDATDRPAPGTAVSVHQMVRDLETGRILSNRRIVAPVTAAQPEILLALAALEMALEQIAERLEARLEVIEDKVGDILRLASAERLGDVYGHQRVLRRKVDEIAQGKQLTSTDWSSIAMLGTDLEVGVERLRYHAVQQLNEFRREDSADQRADKLKAAVNKGMMVETLQLLLVAQQSLYLWQKLRLERVRAAEPDFLEQTLDSARMTVREQLDADRELAAGLRAVLDSYSVLRVSEVHRQLAGRTLSKYRAPLQQVVDSFVEARSLQVDDWLGTEHARFRDALGAARSQVISAGNAGRQQLARGAGKFADWVNPDAETSTPDTDTPSENDSDSTASGGEGTTP